VADGVGLHFSDFVSRRAPSQSSNGTATLSISTRLRLFVAERDGENESGLTKSKAVSGLAWHRPGGLSLARRSIRSRPPSRSIALAVIAYTSGRKGNGHACRRAAGHRHSHKKNEHVSHRPIQRRALMLLCRSRAGCGRIS
jgi:hypothetical protein